MRVIAGIYKGGVLKAPHGHITHPMSEKIRGAIFNALGDITGLTMLDAFSGSGAVAIEASSRGIKQVLAIDNSKKAIQTINENIDHLRISNIKVTSANVSSWSENNKNITFDIVVCDPPYDKVSMSILNKLENHVTAGGLFILSLPPGINYGTELNHLIEKDYGDARLLIYRK